MLLKLKIHRHARCDDSERYSIFVCKKMVCEKWRGSLAPKSSKTGRLFRIMILAVYPLGHYIGVFSSGKRSSFTIFRTPD